MIPTATKWNILNWLYRQPESLFIQLIFVSVSVLLVKQNYHVHVKTTVWELFCFYNVWCFYKLFLILLFLVKRWNKNWYECNIQEIEGSISDAKKSAYSMFSWSDFFVNALALELAALFGRFSPASCTRYFKNRCLCRSKRMHINTVQMCPLFNPSV